MKKYSLRKMHLLFVLIVCMSYISDATPARRVLTFPEIDAQSENNNLNKNDEFHSRDVEETIREVESLIKTNPSLPRLTRGEILDIIENITNEDKEIVKSGVRDQKAIMYVMPYSPDNAQNGDMQSLYTKPPVTAIVGQTTPKPVYRRRRPTQKPDQEVDTQTTSTTTPMPSTTSSRYQFKFEESEAYTQKTTEKTTTVAYRPLRRRTTTTKPQTTSKYPNHKYPDDLPTINFVPNIETTTAKPETTTRLSAGGINIINPPKFYSKPERQSYKTEKPFKPIRTSTSTTLAPIMLDDIQIPNDLKDVLKNLDILIEKSPNSAATFIPLPAGLMQKEANINELLATIQQEKQVTTTTTLPLPDISQVADNLSPEMKELLMNFGLIPDPNKKEVPIQEAETILEPISEINAEAYTNFRPLPESEKPNPDLEMEEFLNKFGLGTKTGKRSQKAIPMNSKQNNLNLDVIPSNFKDVISDIGLTKDTKLNNEETKPKKEEKDHIFSPTDNEYVTQEEINRLNQLMGIIKQFDNSSGTISDDDLKHIDVDGLKDLVQSFNVPLNEQEGPNPLDYDTSVQKNEVKRQSTTEKSVTINNPSLAALEESFGGSADTISETKVPITEPPRKTGFYYLIDWNTFLDIDNEKGKRVNLRFQPKAGDPKRFLSVSVP